MEYSVTPLDRQLAKRQTGRHRWFRDLSCSLASAVKGNDIQSGWLPAAPGDRSHLVLSFRLLPCNVSTSTLTHSSVSISNISWQKFSFGQACKWESQQSTTICFFDFSICSRMVSIILVHYTRIYEVAVSEQVTSRFLCFQTSYDLLNDTAEWIQQTPSPCQKSEWLFVSSHLRPRRRPWRALPTLLWRPHSTWHEHFTVCISEKPLFQAQQFV